MNAQHRRQYGPALALVAAVIAVTLAVPLVANGQVSPAAGARGGASATSKSLNTASQQAASADTVDFVQDGLKFHKVTPPGFIPAVWSATDIQKIAPAGQLMDRGDGSRTVVAYSGYNQSKIEAAYLKHVNGGQEGQPTQVAGNTPPANNNVSSVPVTTASPGWDAASKTVTLSGGRSVTFVDDDHATVTLPGPTASKVYDLHFHKAGVGGFMKQWAHREQSRVGGSLGGGGVTISLEPQQVGGVNIPGGQVYDTAGGTVYASSGFQQAKAVTAAVREAADLVKNSGQPDLAKLNVVKSLLSNNLGI